MRKKVYDRLRKSKHTLSMTSSQDRHNMISVLHQDQLNQSSQTPIVVLDSMMQTRPSADLGTGTTRNMREQQQRFSLPKSNQLTPLLIPIAAQGELDQAMSPLSRQKYRLDF